MISRDFIILTDNLVKPFYFSFIYTVYTVYIYFYSFIIGNYNDIYKEKQNTLQIMNLFSFWKVIILVWKKIR